MTPLPLSLQSAEIGVTFEYPLCPPRSATSSLMAICVDSIGVYIVVVST